MAKESGIMYRCLKKDVVQPLSSVGQDLVLEDTEDGETYVGEGNVAIKRPDSGNFVEQRVKKNRSQIVGSLNHRELERPKGALNQPRYTIEDQQKRREPHRVSSDEYRILDELTLSGSIKFTAAIEQLEVTKNISDTAIRKDQVPLKTEKNPVDVRNMFEDAQKNVEDKSKQSMKRKPMSRTDLLAMLDMGDPNCSGFDAMTKTEEPSLIEKKPASKLGELELGDMDRDDQMYVANEVIPSFKPFPIMVATKQQYIPIDRKTAQDLKKVIFGTSLQQFYDEWKLQSFTFHDKGSVKYGIIQKKGGPCGILAAVQACFLQELIFGDYDPTKDKLNPTHAEKAEALAAAISKILWRCGDQQMAVIALPGNRALFPGSDHYKADGLTETLMLTKHDDFKNLLRFVRSNIRQFESDNSPGVILLLYSAVLSRAIDGVRSDMDDRNGKLIGQHFYCTQDMVNLLLTGRACSNTFNDVIELKGSDDITVLKGLTKRSDIGFLSLFEHFKSCEVGTYYKTPKYPIWVVCCESHFSVFFATKKELISDWKAERRFNLFYYDGLGSQCEEIKLTIDTTGRFYMPPVDEDMVPPIENCIRTKWPEAAIDWNGTEPLL